MRDRSPTAKLFIAGLVGLALLIPMIMVYGLVSDRQEQARVAQDAITAGAGGAQTISGPVLAIPFRSEQEVQTVVDGQTVTRPRTVRSEIFLFPQTHDLTTTLEPELKRKAIYETVTYLAKMEGKARFELPDDLARYGVKREQLLIEEAEIRFSTFDPRGLRSAANVRAGGKRVDLTPGKGGAQGGGGFHGPIEWSGTSALTVDYAYVLRGSRALALTPQGGETRWTVRSPWQHPGFGGGFLPDESEIGPDGFSARWTIGNLALGQGMMSMTDNPSAQPPVPQAEYRGAEMAEAEIGLATINLVEPADIYAQVDRSVKYGFLFIGFTFLAFLLFDVVGGARVAAAEYLLTGAGLVLFFVLLLAFAEITGFALAYVIASAAIIGLLTAYSAAVLGGWKRAGFIGGLLTLLYGGLYVLLSLEEASLIVGALAMFFALASVMYATRNLDWSTAVRREEGEGTFAP